MSLPPGKLGRAATERLEQPAMGLPGVHVGREDLRRVEEWSQARPLRARSS